MTLTKYWTLLKTALNRQKYQNDLPDYFYYNNNNIFDKKLIVDQFNAFLANIGSEISENVGPAEHTFHQYMDQSNQHSMFLDPIDSNIIIAVVSKIKAKTSVDLNNISTCTKIMKTSIINRADPLNTHYSRCGE